jgi:acetyl/propionyl-CoA carboxylase alpha subunit
VCSFAVDHSRVLIICRGPVRKEAFDVFDSLGVEYGMLLSEKDSIVFPRSLAPELRSVRDPSRVHRVQDYMGVGQQEKRERIDQIIRVAIDHGYTHIFAGYGFMAEDAELIEAIEAAGVGFIGPSARVVRQAGSKDEAKKVARRLGNAVIPGVDDISARALLARVKDRAGLVGCAGGLPFAYDATATLEENAEALLQAGYAAGVELVTVRELQAAAEAVCRDLFAQYPGRRIRFKHIGGGGGKGQRVVAKLDEVASAIMDVLAEAKALQPGSNRNFLLELNIERTRHNEIQLLGNGAWCVSLGGRDCSVQMHEQKLVEVSLTRETLDAEIAQARGTRKSTLQADRDTLARMEAEAASFGRATHLDSASTFECVVDGSSHFFMEMNTRIQVEHVVTELVYDLRFERPEAPGSGDLFYVRSLIEAMVLLAVHGPRLPEPTRVIRHRSALEVRINATNAALQPHAGGVIRAWSPPTPAELRFDQGIGTRNPDTNSFIYYHLAGAYDSNIALSLSHGDSRRQSYASMVEILRTMELRGDDLQTNLYVHYGLLSWFLGKGPMAKPTTRFMQSYLAGIGALHLISLDVDVDALVGHTLQSLPRGEAREVFAKKETLLLRPLRRLLGDPHLLGGFLGRYDGELWRRRGTKVQVTANPVSWLAALYHYLRMEPVPGRPPCDVVWDHDAAILDAARTFYDEIERRTGITDWAATQALFEAEENDAASGGDAALWAACQAAHRGFQVGLELLVVIPRIGIKAGFADIAVPETLDITFPAAFEDPDGIRERVRVLAPPPKASSDEIVTPMSGMFYAREAPDLPPLIDVGERFEVGQPLFVIEVMKMFNKVLAPFSGRILENLMVGRDGTTVKKGEVIFRIEPDERAVPESTEQIRERRRTVTLGLLS